ncbi:hypothetical protein FA15DRAFT_641250 [Coprinopsis marcescibilis]|uniref:Uncharacterized protein n=1 Tax=Coprinopsis marcescibilis TaxID=230819 RepID=A0A5C3KUE3_COPMA|nr:hypothetical protein FA15DRAFT_641250 [Coprinopsis marcescibilis]
MKSFSLCHFFLFLFHFAVFALANTELIYFDAQEVPNPEIQFQHTWPTLDAYTSSIRWGLGANPPNTTDIADDPQPCSNVFSWTPTRSAQGCLRELWVILDLDCEPWKKYNNFTLRISWPASYPVEAHVRVFEPSALTHLSTPGPPRRYKTRSASSMTRQKYGRIQLVSTVVWTPEAQAIEEFLKTLDAVPIIITLEPLLLGILEASQLPTVIAVVLALILGFFIARLVISHLEDVVTLRSQPKETARID